MKRQGRPGLRSYRWFVVVLVAVAVFSAGGYLAVTGRETASTPVQLGPLDGRHPLVGAPAPDFRLMDARDGTRNLRLSDFRGRAVVLNWYATWCGACKSEIPEFQRAYEALRGEVVFIGVNLRESRSAAAKLMDEVGAHFPTVLDQDGSVARQYRVVGMPSTFVIDREGIIRSVRSGAIDAEVLRQLMAAMGYAY